MDGFTTRCSPRRFSRGIWQKGLQAIHVGQLPPKAPDYLVLKSPKVCRSVLQCVAVCCSVLQCVAVCCSVLQCVAPMHRSVWCWRALSYGSSRGPVWGSTQESEQLGVMRYYNVDESSVAVCCSVLQCVVVCCRAVGCTEMLKVDESSVAV